MQYYKYKVTISAALMTMFAVLPNTSYAAGVDAVLLLPFSWLISLVLAIISIAIYNKKLVILYIHLGSAAFYIVSRSMGVGELGIIIGFSYLILYPIISSCCILILSFRWRSLAKKSIQG